MKMIRVIPIILICSILMAAVPITAASTPALLSVEKKTLTPQDGVVEILLETSVPIQGGSFNLIYDSGILNYQSSRAGGITYEVNERYEGNKIRVSFASSTELTGGCLISIFFSVSALESCTTELNLEAARFYDANGNSVEATVKGAVCEVKVTKSLREFSLSKNTLNLGQGETALLDLNLQPYDAYVDSVEWTSSAPSVVEVDSNGRLTAKQPGFAQITCRVKGIYRTFTDFCDVTVYQKPNLSIGGANLAKGEEVTLSVRLNAFSNELSAGSLNLVYDRQRLELVSAVAGEMLQNAMVTVNPSYREDAVRLNFGAGQHVLSGSGELCLLTFRAREDGEASITAQDVLLYTGDGIALSVNAGGGAVTVANSTLTLSDAEATAWKTFEMTLSYTSELPVSGGGIVIQYDPQKLCFLGADPLVPAAFTVNPSYGEGLVKISFAGTQELKNLDLAKLRFISVENETATVSTQVSILSDQLSLYNGVGMRVVPTVDPAQVTILPNPQTPEIGDVNTDGALDTRDAFLLVQYLNGTLPYLIPGLADQNGDGRIDQEDALYLMRVLAEWDLPNQ